MERYRSASDGTVTRCELVSPIERSQPAKRHMAVEFGIEGLPIQHYRPDAHVAEVFAAEARRQHLAAQVIVVAAGMNPFPAASCHDKHYTAEDTIPSATPFPEADRRAWCALDCTGSGGGGVDTCCGQADAQFGLPSAMRRSASALLSSDFFDWRVVPR